MTIAARQNLFEPAETPVLGSSIQWIANLVLGELALTMCVLAVAFVGFIMLSGRLAVREGLTVMLGCFILLGAPVIAVSLMGFTHTG